LKAYLKRLAKSVAANQLADIVSKFMAVLLLPLYTRYISPSGYGVVELLANGTIFVSIVVRFGVIEAFARFYFFDEDPDRRAALIRRSVGFLLGATTITAGVLAAAAGPVSKALLSHRDVPTFLIAVLGLWTFTNLELAYWLLRVDERARVYATASLINVGLTIVTSVILVVAVGMGARGLLLANYGASAIVLAGLWWMLRGVLRPRPGARAIGERLPVLLRFGLPTVPAEVSVYALSLVDRYYLYHARSAALAGVYSIAIKLAGAVGFIVRAFQYAWPPLAYSVRDDAEAARLYGLVTTYYVLVSGAVVAALALLSRWILRLLATHAYFGAYKAVPWVALGWALYGLWVIFLVIAGRANATTRNFPAAFAGLAVNVTLLVLVVPQVGLAGAGIALSGAYVVMLVVMHLLTRGLFTVRFEWRRLGQIVVVMGAVAALGDLLLPTHGLAGFTTRALALLVIPAALLVTHFPHPEELGQLRLLARRGVAGGQA
jgi:O-antigen/teichoic acid export membrane protein